MSLRKKTLLALGAMQLTLIAVLIATFHVAVQGSFTELRPSARYVTG